MQQLDWGSVSPEAANVDKKEFYYIYNHNLSSEEKIDRSIRFILGRLIYYDKHLPENPFHIIKLDARGQQLSHFTCDFIIKRLKNQYNRPASLNIEIIR